MLPHSSEHYQKMVAFCKKVFEERNVSSVLDCACGTGHHAIALSKLGYDTEGCDLSSGMIKHADENAAAAEAKAKFVQADFKRLPQVFTRKFDCVLCVGNALTHELQDDAVLSALKSMHQGLGDGGTAIIQVRNIPKLVKDNVRFLPVQHYKDSKGDLKLFFYVLDFYPSKVTFNVVSYIENDGHPNFEVNSVDYNPLSQAKLASLMAEAGFKNLATYGGFDFAPFVEKASSNIVIVGNK